MSVFDVLTEEHRLFERSLEQLEIVLELDEISARERVRKILQILLPELDRHEDIEEMALDLESCRHVEGSGRFLTAYERQNRELDEIRDEMMLVLKKGGTEEFEALRAQVKLFVQTLRKHFLSEERELWPFYNRCMSRSLSHSMERSLRDAVEALREDMRRREKLLDSKT